MNKQTIFLLLSLCGVSIALNARSDRRYVVDTIKAVVYGEDADDCEIVTMSDTMRPGIDGVVHSLDDRVFEKLLWFDGKKHRILLTEEDIERHLKVVERESNIGRKELIDIFSNSGYTLEEGKAQFGIMYTANIMIDTKVRGGLFVAQKEVEAYYRENPEYVEATYLLKRGFVPYDYSISEEEQRVRIEDAIAHNSDIPGVVWSPAFSLTQNQISSDKAHLQEGETSLPALSQGGFEVFQVISITPRRLKTLDERYAHIADLLRRPKYQEILSNYKKQLYDHASIVYF